MVYLEINLPRSCRALHKRGGSASEPRATLPTSRARVK
jgi:hypothetical protein